MNIRDIVARALAEDLGAGDVTTQALFPDAVPAVGTIVAEERDGLVLAGLAVAVEVFRQVDSSLTCSPNTTDGARIPHGTTVLTVTGDGRSLLKMEKWAVTLGGGHNHRYGLGDGILIKDNHLALAGGDVARACRLVTERAKRAPHGLKIEVEVRTLDEVQAALDGGADIILLDNMDAPSIRKAVELIKGRAVTEASGGVTLATVREIAAAGPDLISVGALTHSAPAANLSMDIVSR
ncbi:MAG: nicotinate-nucleotide diphosphorylase (carboxylating) [Nitrospirae bacterium]|nr:nicotinate-nucleotide diphosphorylase (carboxylating) [Nitrospirota bacterium]